MTRVLRDQSSNPTRILSFATSSAQSTMSTAPALPSSAPAQTKDTSNKDVSSDAQTQDDVSSQEQGLCPNARLRLHMNDLTHPAIPTFTRAAPLSSLIEDAIKHVQERLFVPPQNDSNKSSTSNRPPPQKPLPPKHEIWKPQEVRSITLIVRPMDGVAYTTGTELDEAHKEIHLSLDYLQAKIRQFYGDTGSDAKNSKADASFIHELRGVVTHEMVHAFQHNGRGSCPGGLIEGIADYVRLKSGLGAEHWNPWPAGTRTRGEKWDEGYQKTAWFLTWVEDTIGGKGAIGRLNEALRESEWEDGKVWEKVMGKTVHACWGLYKVDWDRLNKQHEKPLVPQE